MNRQHHYWRAVNRGGYFSPRISNSTIPINKTRRNTTSPLMNRQPLNVISISQNSPKNAHVDKAQPPRHKKVAFTDSGMFSPQSQQLSAVALSLAKKHVRVLSK